MKLRRHILTVGWFLTALLATADPLPLGESEQAYLARIWPITMVVDPDWYPYETLDSNGQHVGIAAELVRLIAARAGVGIPVLKTKDWDESIALAKTGKAKLVSFLNQTPNRDEWLLFTDPYFTDPNVFITREEHDYISDPARLKDETVVLPTGTSMEEKLRAEYPNLKIVLVASEREALREVNERRADMTLRSLTMAAYTIKSESLFNLKIAGQIPTFTNQFRMGVTKSEPRLRDILNRAIATLTPQEIETAVNHHIAIRVGQVIDYTWAFAIGAGALVLVLLGLIWIRQLSRLNAALAQREAEKALILKEVHHRIKNNLTTIQGLLFLQAEAMPNSEAAAVLEDAQNRVSSMALLYDKLYRSEVYGPILAAGYFSDLVDRIVENFPESQFVKVEKRLEEVTLTAEQLQPLGILLNELITNVMKYAFRGRQEGRILLAISRKQNTIEVILEDDGPGLPQNVDFQNSTGFGLQLVGLLTQQLNGTIAIDPERRARVVLTFPLNGP